MGAGQGEHWRRGSEDARGSLSRQDTVQATSCPWPVTHYSLPTPATNPLSEGQSLPNGHQIA